MVVGDTAALHTVTDQNVAQKPHILNESINLHHSFHPTPPCEMAPKVPTAQYIYV